MTGLLSLSALEARLAAQPGPCGVVFVDLDGMKDVNDRHGHEVGDRLLRWPPGRLSQVVPSGFAAPIGSDEFVLLVPGLDDAVALDWVVTRVGETLAVPFDIGLAEPVEVSATAAGALWRPGDDPRSVFGTVDERVMVGKVYRREDGFGKLADLVAGVLDRAPDVELLDAAAGAMMHLAGADLGLVLVAGEVAFAPDLAAAGGGGDRVPRSRRRRRRPGRFVDIKRRAVGGGRRAARGARHARRAPSPCSGAGGASAAASACSSPRPGGCSARASRPAHARGRARPDRGALRAGAARRDDRPPEPAGASALARRDPGGACRCRCS